MLGMRKFLMVRPVIESGKISIKDQKEYNLEVGMFLYLVKLSRHDIAHAIRKLSKENSGANPVLLKM